MIKQIINYLNNRNLKAAGVQIQYTQEQAAEYLKCYDDPLYFIQKYVKIVSIDKGLVPFDMFDWQKEYTKLIHENRFTIGKVARQSGKCFSKTTTLRLKHKKTNQVIEMTAEDFYKMISDTSSK